MDNFLMLSLLNFHEEISHARDSVLLVTWLEKKNLRQLRLEIGVLLLQLLITINLCKQDNHHVIFNVPI